MDGSYLVRGCGCDANAVAHSLLNHIEAQDLALKLVNPIEDIEIIPISTACGRYTAKQICALHAMPSFDNAAMDGFALRFSDIAEGSCLSVAGTVAAGDAPRNLPKGAALRIYTGAPLPEGADTVVMIEACIDKQDKVHIDRMPTEGENIRRAGSDQAKGQLLVAARTRLAPHHIGLLAANGLTQITVVRRLRVAVFSTGDEVTEGTCALGQIPDANRPMLLALFTQAGVDADDLGILPDNPAAITAEFHALDEIYDLIVTTGAVSMGGKDHIQRSLINAGGDIHAWRVALKPGKPVMFGKLRQTAFTGLPGNPFAVHVGFHLFVAPQIARLTGGKINRFAQEVAIAGFDWHRKSGRAEVFPVRRRGHNATGLPVLERLGNGVSATLLPLSGADGLAMVPAHLDTLVPGGALQWHPFFLEGGNS